MRTHLPKLRLKLDKDAVPIGKYARGGTDEG